MRPFLLFLLGAACAAQTPPPAPVPPAPAAQTQQDPLLRERAAAAENIGRFGEAADHYLKLMQQDPTRADWAIAAGRCLGRSGRYNDAIDLLTQKRNAFPGIVDVTAMLARTYLLKAEGDQGGLNPELAYQDAVRLAEEVLAIDPNHEDSRLILAQAKYGLGDFAAAVAAADEAVRRLPQRAGAHVLAGRIAYDRFKALKQAFERDAASLDDDARAARVAELDAQRQRAKQAFLRAAELDPNRTFARIALGQIAVIDKEPDQALAQWAEALVVDPQARVDHAWIEQRLTWEQRRDFYQQVVQRYRARAGTDRKMEAGLNWYVARALFDGKKWSEAHQTFSDVAFANREYTNALYWAGLAAHYQGDDDSAGKLLGRYAMVSATAFADVLRGLAPEARAEVAQLVQRLADDAFQRSDLETSRDLNHVTAAFRDSADAWNNYAFLCRESGRFREAVAGYEHALEKEPGSPQLMNDLAVVLHYHLPSDENLKRAKELYQLAIGQADRVLAEPSSTDLARKLATQAKSDAQLNLGKLK